MASIEDFPKMTPEQLQAEARKECENVSNSLDRWKAMQQAYWDKKREKGDAVEAPTTPTTMMLMEAANYMRDGLYIEP